MIVFDDGLTAYDISVETTTAMDFHLEDIQEARDRFPADAGPVFDAFGLIP